MTMKMLGRRPPNTSNTVAFCHTGALRRDPRKGAIQRAPAPEHLSGRATRVKSRRSSRMSPFIAPMRPSGRAPAAKLGGRTVPPATRPVAASREETLQGPTATVSNFRSPNSSACASLAKCEEQQRARFCVGEGVVRTHEADSGRGARSFQCGCPRPENGSAEDTRAHERRARGTKRRARATGDEHGSIEVRAVRDDGIDIAQSLADARPSLTKRRGVLEHLPRQTVDMREADALARWTNQRFAAVYDRVSLAAHHTDGASAVGAVIRCLEVDRRKRADDGRLRLQVHEALWVTRRVAGKASASRRDQA